MACTSQSLLVSKSGSFSRTVGLSNRTLASHKSRPSQLRCRTHRHVRIVAQAAAKPTKVKVCGVTSKEDAALATDNGADFIGMILWPNSKRSIPMDVAQEVVDAAREGGAEPVGVFVSETADEIIEACDTLGLKYAQLHGDGARAALADIPQRLRAIYVLNAGEDGVITTPLPGETDEVNTVITGEKGWRKASDWMSRGRRTIDYILVDGMNPGSGETFDWKNLKVRRGASRYGWILAGGLEASNVSEAIESLGPDVVDVASGVTLPDGVKKDPQRVKHFMDAVQGVKA